MKKAILFVMSMAILMTAGCGAVAGGGSAGTTELSASERSSLEQKVDELQAKVDQLQATMDKNFGNGTYTQTQYTKVENIDYDVSITNAMMTVYVKNNTSEILPEIKLNVVYYDEAGEMIYTDYSFVSYVFPGTLNNAIVQLPNDGTGNLLSYDHYEIQFYQSDQPVSYESAMDAVTVEKKDVESGCILTFNNKGDRSVEEADAIVLYYKDGTIVGNSTNYIYSLAAGETQLRQCTKPTDDYGNVIEYDSTEVKLTGAYYSGGTAGYSQERGE